MPVSSQIEIAVPPAAVREKFLQFDKIPTYHTYGHFGVHTSTSLNGTFNKGDRMKVAVNGMKFTAIVTENSPQAFIWASPKTSFLNAILYGEHSFRFQPSEITNGGTTFVQAEIFSGALSFLFGENWVAGLIGIRAKTERGFEAYNKDLKAWCEESSEGT